MVQSLAAAVPRGLAQHHRIRCNCRIKSLALARFVISGCSIFCSATATLLLYTGSLTWHRTLFRIWPGSADLPNSAACRVSHTMHSLVHLLTNKRKIGALNSVEEAAEHWGCQRDQPKTMQMHAQAARPLSDRNG